MQGLQVVCMAFLGFESKAADRLLALLLQRCSISFSGLPILVTRIFALRGPRVGVVMLQGLGDQLQLVVAHVDLHGFHHRATL